MKKLLSIFIIFTLAACQQDGAHKSSLELETRKTTLKDIAKRAKADGNLQGAAQLEAQIIALDQKDAGSFVTLSKSLRKLRQHREAEALLNNALEANPDNDLILIELAKVLIERNEAESALGRLSLVKGEKNEDFYNTQGVAYDMDGQHGKAQDSYREGLKLDAQDDILLNNLALSYVLDRKYKEGTTILEGLVKRPDTKPKYRQNLALAYAMMAEPKKAREMLLKDLSRKQAEENLRFYDTVRKNSRATIPQLPAKSR